MKHKLICESYQWSEVRGGRPQDARTWYFCTVCGAHFTHRYNIQPNIYEAAKRHGFDFDGCPGSEKSRTKQDRFGHRKEGG